MLHLEVGERPVSLSDVSRERDDISGDVGNRSGSIENMNIIYTHPEGATPEPSDKTTGNPPYTP